MDTTFDTLQPGESLCTVQVTRCGCRDPLSHALQGLPCPTPRAVEEPFTVRAQRTTKEDR